MHLKILGIDPSLNSTGLCLINERGTILNCMAVHHALDDPERLLYIYGIIKEYIESYSPDYIVYERQVPQMRYNYSASSLIPLAELAGILKLIFLKYCKSHDAIVCRYPPEDIKRAATNNPKADKDEMIASVPTKQLKKIKECVPEWSVNDVSDAYHTANLVRKILSLSKDSINKPIINGKEYDLITYISYNKRSVIEDEESKSSE